MSLYQVAFRPRVMRRLPLPSGRVYLDRQTADIVRLDLAFPRAAIRDARIEVLTVVLENALVERPCSGCPTVKRWKCSVAALRSIFPCVASFAAAGRSVAMI